MNKLLAIGLLALVGISCKHNCKDCKEEKTALTDTPAAVQASIAKLTAGAELGKVKKEEEDGKVVYEVKYERGDSDHSATIAPDGTVIEEETEIDPAKLPAEVSAAVMAKYASAKIEEAELVTAGGKTWYELAVEVGEDDHEIKIADGKIVSDEVEKEAKEKK